MKSRADYESELRVLRAAICEDPYNADEYRNEIKKIVAKWMELLPVTVFVANNEQKPWDITSIGFEPCPMPTKNGTGLQQVGDYQYWIDTPGKPAEECYGPLLVERKSLEDFYSTMFGDRDRFYREIARFRKDPRFNLMVVIIEGDVYEWCEYKPKHSRSYRATCKREVTLEGKQAAIATLLMKGIMPVFAGNRKLAPKMYRHLVRQNIVHNWERWIPPVTVGAVT